MLHKLLVLAAAVRASAFGTVPREEESLETRTGAVSSSLPAGAVAHFRNGGWQGTTTWTANSWPNEGSAGGSATFSGTAMQDVYTGGGGLLGSEVPVNALRGVTTSSIDFGNVIKREFTICSATRYSDLTPNKMRILQGEGANWLHGHHDNKAGVAYYASASGWKTPEANQKTPNYDWVILCASNAGDQLTLINDWTSAGLISREVVGSTTGGSGDVVLKINAGAAWSGGNEKSDFDVAEVITWDRGLTAAEMWAAHDYLMYSVLGVGTRPPTATSSLNVVVGMPMSATEAPPVRAPSATAAAAMLVDSTGDGLADSVHVDTTGDGRPDTIVPLGESAHARPLNASDMELEVRELRKSIAETKRQRSLTRQALEDALRAGGGESNTSVAGEPVPAAPVPPQYLCPITGEVMEDPVTTADGHAYERAAIAQWLQAHDTSPVTNAQLPHRKLAPAHALRQLIEEFVATNPEALISTEPSYTERRCSGSI